MAGGKEDAKPGSTLLVIHNFVARTGDELALAKGDRIELIERDDDFGDGWFLGRHLGNGKTGLFPEVYTTLAPKSSVGNVVQPRRESEGLPSTPRSPDTATTGTTANSPTQQQRHASTSAVPTQPPTTSPTKQQATTPAIIQPALKPVMPPTVMPPTSAPKTDPIPTASPVMHETLSVIDEHMNDMNTPPGSFTNSKRSASGVGYSYIAGHETDEEENHLHTEEEVLSWTPERVAEYLDDQGVENAHCDVFKEQEISGEVLLAMEQSSIFLKEFALGSVGRRLKTWHKIRALQNEVRQSKSGDVPKPVLEYPEEEDEEDEDEEGGAAVGPAGRSRASTVGSVLPRALDTSRQSVGGAPAGSDTLKEVAAPSSMQGPASAVAPEHTWDLSVQAMREQQISRKQVRRQSRSPAGSLDVSAREGHRKQASMDDTWRLGQAQIYGEDAQASPSMSSDVVTSRGPGQEADLNSPSASSTPGVDDVDRGYNSSNETDTRAGAGNSRTARKKLPSSVASGDNISRNNSNRRSTLSGGFMSGDSLRESLSPSITQGIFGALNSVGNTFRSPPQIRRKPMAPLNDNLNPIVTKLDYSASTDALPTSPNTNMSGALPTPSRSVTNPKIPLFSAYKAKATGLRATSDAVTKGEKLTASPVKEATSPARTGSTTPSTETQSLEFQKSEAQMRSSLGSGANLAPPQQPQMNQRRIRVKPKKATSAYTRGLEHKTPAEQIQGSDYSGWMKKKSGSLMATWKTRLFVLRGRRLSYYYADSDTEEKGLIDISFHRVLPAHNETLTGLHAAMTGATGSPSSPKDSSTQTAAQTDLENQAADPALAALNAAEPQDGIFIFKLVPPKSGLAKGVNFTKPTVHYFAVNSRAEGRLWMAALMKATIDREDGGMVTTTYNQKTISLAKARARRERPPALRDMDEEGEEEGEEARAELEGEDDSSGRGLGIAGLDGEEDNAGGGAVAPGAEAEGESVVGPSMPDDSSSVAASTLAPSTAATATTGADGEAETVGVARG